MVAAPFRYERVTSFEEAARALRERGEDAKVIAGGQSLVPMLNLRLARPAWLIDINPVGAGPIEDHGGYLRLPALTRHRAIEAAEVVRRRCPILAEAAACVGNVRTRTRGTIGGSLAHADPAGELPCVAVALGAEVTVQGPDGARDVPVGDLLVSYLSTTLAPDEVVAEVRVPTLGPRSGWSFLELCRRSGDWMVGGGAARAGGGRGRRHARPRRRRARLRHLPAAHGRGPRPAGARRGGGAGARRREAGPMSDPGRQRVAFTVNGEQREAWVFPHDSLLDVLRDDLGHHEVRYGCGEGVCGTCTVLLDGEPVSGCLLLAVQADGCSLVTVRGLAPGGGGGGLHPLQACFLRHGAAQCDFCTPGMLLTAWALLQRDPRPSRERIRRELTGNLCRCTGYSKILDAVQEHAAQAAEETGGHG